MAAIFDLVLHFLRTLVIVFPGMVESQIEWTVRYIWGHQLQYIVIATLDPF